MDQPEVYKKSIMAQLRAGGHQDDASANNKTRRNKSHGMFPGSSMTGAGKPEQISALKLWGVTQEVLRSLGFFFVQDELMHLGFNEEKIPVELRQHLPPLKPSLSLMRGPDDVPVAQQQAELLNKRLHALKPGTLLSLDGQFRFHMDDENFPSSFQELLALRDARFRGAGSKEENF